MNREWLEDWHTVSELDRFMTAFSEAYRLGRAFLSRREEYLQAPGCYLG
jgi:hypothetical protein